MIRLCAFADEAGSSIDAQIDALRRNDISKIELRNIDGVSVADFTEEKAKEYAKIFFEEGISVWAIGSPLGKVDINCDFNKYLDKVKRVAEIANVFSTDKIRAFSFYKAYSEKQKVFDYMNKMAEVAKEYNVFLYHENEKDIYGDTLQRVLEIRSNVRAWKYVYDPANFIQVGEKADDTLSALADKTDYFHIKDVIKKSGVLVPAGEGDGKIDELVGRIMDDKTLTIEPHLHIFDAYKDIDGSALTTKYSFSSAGEAFDCACSAIKKVIKRCGYKKTEGGYIK